MDYLEQLHEIDNVLEKYLYVYGDVDVYTPHNENGFLIQDLYRIFDNQKDSHFSIIDNPCPDGINESWILSWFVNGEMQIEQIFVRKVETPDADIFI